MGISYSKDSTMQCYRMTGLSDAISVSGPGLFIRFSYNLELVIDILLCILKALMFEQNKIISRKIILFIINFLA